MERIPVAILLPDLRVGERHIRLDAAFNAAFSLSGRSVPPLYRTKIII